MPAVRTSPKDVLIRVPKVEPYSNRYVAPLARAQEEAKKLAAAAAPTSTSTDLINPLAPVATDPSAPEAEKERGQRSNSPILPFLHIDRHEDQTVDLSKAATSSAGWNSLLVWARRQRGAQWDESTAIWQVDKGSSEYYSFCADPATTTRPGEPKKQKPAESTASTTAQLNEDEDKGPIRISIRNRSAAVGEDGTSGAGTTASPPPVSSGRTIRLLRRP